MVRRWQVQNCNKRARVPARPALPPRRPAPPRCAACRPAKRRYGPRGRCRCAMEGSAGAQEPRRCSPPPLPPPRRPSPRPTPPPAARPLHGGPAACRARARHGHRAAAAGRQGHRALLGWVGGARRSQGAAPGSLAASPRCRSGLGCLLPPAHRLRTRPAAACRPQATPTASRPVLPELLRRVATYPTGAVRLPRLPPLQASGSLWRTWWRPPRPPRQMPAAARCCWRADGRSGTLGSAQVRSQARSRRTMAGAPAATAALWH